MSSTSRADAGARLHGAARLLGAARLPNAARPHIVLTLFGRCGSVFVHSLFDGHPQLASIPGIAPNMVLNELSQHQSVLATASTDELAAFVGPRFTDYFNSPVLLAIDGLDRMGDNADECLGIDAAVFQKNLRETLHRHREKALLLRTCEALHDAFDLTLEQPLKPRNFYHAHSLSHAHAKTVVAEIPDHQILYLVREPLDDIESCANSYLGPEMPNRLAQFLSVIRKMLACQSDESGLLGEESVLLRLEDLKQKPAETLAALCDALALDNDPALTQSTFMGRKYHTVPTQRNPGIQGFTGLSAQPKGYRLSERDRAFFTTLFRSTSERFGYAAGPLMNQEEMRKILGGQVLDVELAFAKRSGISLAESQHQAPLIEFRRHLAAQPGILAGPACRVNSRQLFS